MTYVEKETLKFGGTVTKNSFEEIGMVRSVTMEVQAYDVHDASGTAIDLPVAKLTFSKLTDEEYSALCNCLGVPDLTADLGLSATLVVKSKQGKLPTEE